MLKKPLKKSRLSLITTVLTLPLMSAPALLITSCAQASLTFELPQVKAKLESHLTTWTKLAFQFYKPSQTVFNQQFLPSQQDLFGYQLININWNYKNDDHYGLKTIQFDLKRGQNVIKNQKITFGGFLTNADEKQQQDVPALDFKNKIMTYRPNQVRQWWKLALIEEPKLNAVAIADVIKNPDLLKPIISSQITSQAFVLDRVSQVNFQGIDFNALQITIRLKSDQHLTKPLDFIIAGFSPKYYLHSARPEFKKFFDQVISAIRNQKISIFQIASALTIRQFLEASGDLQSQIAHNSTAFINAYLKNDLSLFNNEITNTAWLKMTNIKIKTIEAKQGIIKFSGDLYYNVNQDTLTDGSELLAKDLEFFAFFEPSI